MMARTSRRGPWLPEEDNALIELVRTQGPNNWVRISQQLQHRSPKQCRERYHQNLKPSLNHDPISTEEGEKIEQLVEEMGKRWAEIARRLGNRSDNAVKNWWNGSINRRKRSPSSLHGLKDVDGLHSHPGAAPQIPPSNPADYSPPQPRTLFPRPSQQFRDPWSTQPIDPPNHKRPAPLDLESRGERLAPFSRSSIHSFNRIGEQEQRYVDQGREADEHSARLPPIRLPSISNYHVDSGYVSGLDKPSVSPSASEFSHSYSTRPVPSLISDNQSTCSSISPRFVTSPHSSLPSRADSGSGPYSSNQTQHERPQSWGYQGIKGQMALSPLSIEKFTIPPILTAPEAYQSGYRPASHHNDGRCSSYDHTASRPSEPLRDRRMHVSSLVQ